MSTQDLQCYSRDHPRGGECFDVIIYSSLREVLAVDMLSEAASALGLEAEDVDE